ncbi:MAG: glycosyltransferase [Betaproteobacteria bacterium]
MSGTAAAMPIGGIRHATAPRVSVIIATYNWSAALSLAIRSVLRQTMQDFEILVVGDACTDDSDAVVAAFADARISWHNLALNSGSQQGPNNFGLRIARGEWIAYLGHDDIWAPRHLASTLAAADAADAQVAAGGMIMYGPPGSDATYTAGLFADGHCADDDFVPPSALVHRRALIDVIGPWAEPRSLRLPTDCEFFVRARAASAIASTGEVTVFKFNAAARRNAYQAKSTAEQANCLENLERGDAFVAEEHANVRASRVAGRSHRIMLPDPARLEPGEIFRANRIAKGVEHRFAPDELRSLSQAERFGLEREPEGFEWHAVERHANFGTFRWTGPSARSTIELPIRFDHPHIAMRIGIPFVLVERSLRGLRIEAQGEPIDIRIERDAQGWCVRGVIDRARHASRVPYVQVTLTGVTTGRPVDLGINADKRILGVAVSWIELSPFDPVET